MTKKQSCSSQRLLITPSLLNSWLYIEQCTDSVREAEGDIECLEDKKLDKENEARACFINSLERISTPPSKYAIEGIKFESECYKGNTCISPIIEGGAFQIVGKKDIEVDGIPFLMYGRLDVLKGGVIYDIKRVFRYNAGKYRDSCQHKFYLDLFPSADHFEYLAFDGEKLHIEPYYREDCIPTEARISQFISFLKENNLFDTYQNKWRAR